MLAAVVWLGLLSAPSAAAAAGLPAAWEKGFSYTSWWHDAYQSPQAEDSLARLERTGANAVAIVATWYQDSPTASRVARDPRRSPSDGAVATAVRRAKARGLKVMLRPMVDAQEGGWRGDFAPADRDAWFASYEAMVAHYADLATSLGVDSLQVGAEFRSLTTPANERRWRAVIATARARFRGRLTYAANWDEYRQVGFWDALDVIGIDAYFPLATRPSPHEAAVVAAWSNFTRPDGGRSRYLTEIAQVHARFGKPVIFTEIGYPSALGGLERPWQVGRIYSAEVQRRGLAAAFRALSGKPWFRGMYLWHWTTDSADGGAGDTDHTPKGKPAERTVREWFSGTARVTVGGSPSRRAVGRRCGGRA